MTILKGKVIVVTGGCGLLGRSFIKSILDNDGIAVITDIDSAKGNELVKEFTNYTKNKNVYFQKIDITSESSILLAIDIISAKYSKIDSLVNNAYPRNKSYGNKIESVTYESFCENINLHLGGYFLTSKLFSAYFQKQGWGNIVNMSSVYGVIAPRFEIYQGTEMTMPIEYAAIKSAIIKLTQYFARYYKYSGIRFNCISPGGIFNNQNETFVKKYSEFSLSKGMLEPKDICGTLIFLLSDLSQYINGQNIIVDDGFSL